MTFFLGFPHCASLSLLRYLTRTGRVLYCHYLLSIICGQEMRRERKGERLCLTDLLSKPHTRFPRYRMLIKVELERTLRPTWINSFSPIL